MIVSYNWLQTYFDTELPSSEKITEVLTFGIFEVEGTEKKGNDTIFDIKVLPDRAHDCLSHRGIARVLGALLDMPLRAEMSVSLPEQLPATLTVEVSDKKICKRYIGRIVRGVKVCPSPAWLTERLEAIGQRSINNIVDATNFVMFDIGQPLHAFDAKKLSGGIIVRGAQKGERIITLDKKETVLNESVFVIADNTASLAIAGVKGGKKAEVDDETTDIVLEAANFDPVSVRRTARALGILTDSSKRFENDLTPELARDAMDRVTALIVQIAGGEDTVAESIVDVYPIKQESRIISLSPEDVNRLLGTTLSDEDIEKFLHQLGFSFEKKESPAVFIVAVPPERLDLKETADLVEDIAHVFGYGNIPSIEPKKEPAGINKKFYYTTVLRNALARAGFSEIYGYTFAEDGEAEIANPLQQERKYLRANLTDGMLNALGRNILNAPLLGAESVSLFEIGNVFHKTSEKTLCAVGVHHGRKVNPAPRSVVSDSSTAQTSLQEKVSSWRGVKDGTVRSILARIAEEIGTPSLPTIDGYDLTDCMREVVVLDIDALVVTLPEPKCEYTFSENKPMQYKSFSLYPFIVRDIAVWVPDGTKQSAVTDIILAEGGGILVQGPTLFDEFKKDGKISYAFRFVFQAPDKTLTDLDVNAIMERIYTKLKGLGFVVR